MIVYGSIIFDIYQWSWDGKTAAVKVLENIISESVNHGLVIKIPADDRPVACIVFLKLSI